MMEFGEVELGQELAKMAFWIDVYLIDRMHSMNFFLDWA